MVPMASVIVAATVLSRLVCVRSAFAAGRGGQLGANPTVQPTRQFRPMHHRADGHHGRVLLVEDEPDQAAILEAVLRHEGLDVVVAQSGEQALDIHQRTPADVLVTDLNLPGMTGVDLMKRLSPPASIAADTPEPKAPPPAVVVVTGQSSVT